MNEPTTCLLDLADEPGDIRDVVDAIVQNEIDIARILQSQATMRAVNRAMRAGSDSVLNALQFSPDHIGDLRQRVSNGDAAFPDYVLRNNARLIRRLRAQAADMRLRLERAGAKEFSAAAAPVKRAKYRCEADNVATVPFLACYLPYLG